MNKKEINETISQVEQLFRSEKPEAGLDLLKRINEPKLNEFLADSIQNIIYGEYFEQKSDQKLVDVGLKILHQLLPNIKSIRMIGCYVESLNFSKFLELESLDLSGCDCLKKIEGLKSLIKLNNLDLRYTSSLIGLDENEYSDIKHITGLRNKYGMILSRTLEEYYWDCLNNYLVDEIQNLVDDSYGDFGEYQNELDAYLGSCTIILIDESDLYDKSFQSSREYFKPLEGVLSDEQMKLLPVLGKDYQEDEIAMVLFTNGWDFVTSFYKHRDDLPGEDEF